MRLKYFALLLKFIQNRYRNDILNVMRSLTMIIK